MKKIDTNGMSPCLEYTAEESSNESNDNAVRYTGSAAGYNGNRYRTVSCVSSGQRSRSGPERGSTEAEEVGTARRQRHQRAAARAGAPPPPPPHGTRSHHRKAQ